MKPVTDLETGEPEYMPSLLQELMKAVIDLETGQPEYSLQGKQKLR